MKSRRLWWLAKGLEGLGMVVVLVGVSLSIKLGMDEQGLASMQYESIGLLAGGALFVAGWLLERRIGAR